MAPVIEFEGVSKRFILQHDRPGSFQELFLRFFSGGRFFREEFWALKNITFSVQPGEMLGIIGENGAGKSTILKITAGILDPTLGRVEVGGKVSALLELGAGFHPDLTGRENIYFHGSILGLSKRQIDARFHDIVDFSGLERFLDVPIRHYSSGMYIRLGFAVSTSIDPGGILAVDEVLAVGDEAFQRRCFERIDQLRKEGTTILFVSHDLGSVRRLCDRALWLSQGRIRAYGYLDEVLDAYLEASLGTEEESEVQGVEGVALIHQAEAVKRATREADEASPIESAEVIPSGPMGAMSGEVVITKVEMVGEDGAPRWDFVSGQAVSIRICYEARCDLPRPVFSVAIHSPDGYYINAHNTYADGFSIALVRGKGVVELYYPSLPLGRGEYLLSVGVFKEPDEPLWRNAVDYHEKAYGFFVHSDLFIHGMAVIPAKWGHRSLEQ